MPETQKSVPKILSKNPFIRMLPAAVSNPKNFSLKKEKWEKCLLAAVSPLSKHIVNNPEGMPMLPTFIK